MFFAQYADIYVMPKRSAALETMPSAVLAHLRALGGNLAIARKRRREPLKSWAQRIGVSEPTRMRMEKGDPSVSMGVYATALWLMGRAQSLPECAAPGHDMGALEDAVLGYLFFAGDERFGALGGARPKALLELDGQPWVLKFSEPGEPIDMPLVEHAAMTLAAHAGIRVARTVPVPLPQGHAIAVQRFDRGAGGLRRHALSANVALKAAGEPLGYPELAQWKTHFARTGVAAADIDSLVAAIDRPFLRNQRDAYLK